MRKAHLLRENKGCSYPVRMVFFDTETVPVEIGEGRVEHRFRLGWACFWERRPKRGRDTIEWYRIKDIREFWDWVVGKAYEKARLYLVAHNLDFDMGVTQGYRALLSRGFSLRNHWEKGLSRFYHWRQGSKSLIGIDNANIFATKLERLGESLGLSKLKVDFDAATEEELSAYCHRDVEIILKAWQRWIDFCTTEDLGNFAPTLAAQAFNAFKHRFMPVGIYIHNNVKALTLERECYKGGRTECFWIGRPPGEEFFYLDINSMYPFVMQGYPYPIRLWFYSEDVSPKRLYQLLERYLVCARVIIETEAPVFPVRYKGKTFYPVGEFEAALTTPELLYLHNVGKVKRVLAAAVYDKANIFSKYVDYFYAKRLEAKSAGDDMLSHFYKIMLNSLYGKFGQKSTKWEIIGTCEPGREGVEEVVDAKTGRRYMIRYHNGIVEHSTEEEESWNSFPAIAAHVTAYARMYLWRLIEKAGRENVFYVDTDSLFTNREGYERLVSEVDASILGKLKLEGRAEFLEIRGPKDYTFGQKTKLKGIRGEAVEVAPGVFEQEKWLGFASRLREGKLNTYIVQKQQKALRRVYAKGRIEEGGFVKPWRLPEDWPRIASLL